MKRLPFIATITLILMLGAISAAAQQNAAGWTQDDRYNGWTVEKTFNWNIGPAPAHRGTDAEVYTPSYMTWHSKRVNVARTIGLEADGWVKMVTATGVRWVWQKAGTQYDFDSQGRMLFRTDCGNPAPEIEHPQTPTVDYNPPPPQPQQPIKIELTLNLNNNVNITTPAASAPPAPSYIVQETQEKKGGGRNLAGRILEDAGMFGAGYLLRAATHRGGGGYVDRRPINISAIATGGSVGDVTAIGTGTGTGTGTGYGGGGGGNPTTTNTKESGAGNSRAVIGDSGRTLPPARQSTGTTRDVGSLNGSGRVKTLIY